MESILLLIFMFITEGNSEHDRTALDFNSEAIVRVEEELVKHNFYVVSESWFEWRNNHDGDPCSPPFRRVWSVTDS